MTKISFVYFDVGGVAIKDFSDSPKWEQMMVEMGLNQYDQAEIDTIFDTYEDDICIGKRHVDTLVPIYCDKYHLKLDPNYSMLNYFLDHFEINSELWPIVDKLKSTTKVGLLTDQYLGMLDGIFKRNILPPVEWDVIIDSSVEGVKKPMPEIYQLATTRAGVAPAEILYIDNREKNLVPARELGWQTYLYDSSNYDQANADLAAFLNLQPPGL